MPIIEEIATHAAQSFVDTAANELKYLCCYKSYVDEFEDKKESLNTRINMVVKDINEARCRNENQTEDDVALWLTKANGLIQENTKEKKKWFSLVTNCFWQYKRGKELEGKTQTIKELIEKSNFPRVARSIGLPGIEFYSSQNFMHLEDRKLKFEQLKEACILKDDKKFIIGLHGLGGTGKTTMAIEVGKEVVESKVFDKAIFSVVSKDPNLKKIRDNIAKQLGLSLLDETMGEAEKAQNIWKRIVEGGENLLVILDDVWEKLTL
ncbi:probable disease resistance protein At1g52660 isoform X2 [Prosopis cineraria]|uniref:probable disease resistance protein At1g52660 isoform X2 n=1 Tax=Prosopis cineraria TaxID=364024 RepID=UPI00240F219E|nr:probable disease resistance protein At1g52660 isoform X2 [Prosopis cineraria]